jgi:putative phosphoribosyl transferase
MLAGRRFANRYQAGRVLATRLERYKNAAGVLILGLPRGGIPVACEIAKHLNAPLDVFVVRKVGMPGHEELAMGAIAPGGVSFFDQRLVELVPQDELERVIARELVELARRERVYRNQRPAKDPKGATVIVADDGLATGASMQAAVRALRTLSAGKIIVAVPVASAEALAALSQTADEVVCAYTPETFYAVGQWYDDFSQVSDAEVRLLLERAG